MARSSRGRKQALRPNSEEFDSEVARIMAERYPDAHTRAFAHVALRVALPGLEFTDDQAEDIVSIDRSGDLGCDGIFIDREEHRVVLFQAKSSTALADGDLHKEISDFLAVTQKLGSREWRKTAHADLRSLANEYEEAVLNDCSVTFAFATASVLSAKVRATFRSADLETSDRELVLLDIADLEERYHRVFLGKPGDDTNVRFRVEKNSLHQPPSGRPVVYLTIPAYQYVEACKPHANELFRYNPRLYLGTNKVNTAIEETLEHDDREFFHLLNNGVTAVCRDLSVEVQPNGEWVCDVTNFQVVNGCQTTMTLVRNSALLIQDHKILVDVKIIQDEGLQDLISNATNMQTAIVAEDAFSNDVYQIRIHELMAQYNPPYFYSNKRGLWERLPAPEKRGFEYSSGARFRKYRKLTSKELAAVCMAAFGQPESAKDKPRIAFERLGGQPSSLHRRIFAEAKFAQQWLLPFELFGCANALIKATKAELAVKQATFEATGLDADQEAVAIVERRLRIAEYGRYRVVHLAYSFLKERAHVESDFLPGDTSQALVISIDDWGPHLADMALDALVDSFRDAQQSDQTSGLREFFRETSHQPAIGERFRMAQDTWSRTASRQGESLSQFLKLPLALQ